MSRFTIVVAKHDTEPNAARYDDVVRALGDSLKELGHEVTGLDNPGRLIMFNVNNMNDTGRLLPEDAILFQTEQITAVKNPELLMLAYKENQNRVVWEYAESNARVLLDKLGMRRVVMCPIGYHPSMTRIEPAQKQDIDVLFYGALPPRRTAILAELGNAGIAVKTLYGVYGKDRDRYIARSKIVLNLHYGFDGGAVFEIFRVSYLLSNGKCVVTEDGGTDEKLEAFARQATMYVAKDKLVERCRYLVDHEQDRQHIARKGYEEFKKTSMVDNVRQALERS